MSTRSLALIAIVTFLGAAILVAALTRSPGEDLNAVQPPSTFLVGPGGASGLAEALTGLGVQVVRHRGSFRSLDTTGTAPAALLVVLDPGVPINGREAARLTSWVRHRGPLLLSGARAAEAMECFGWQVERRGADSIQVNRPGERPGPAAPWVRRVLAPITFGSDTVDQVRGFAEVRSCVPVHGQLDTLLATAGARPVLLRLRPKSGYPVYLASEGALFSNRSLRNRATGPFLLGVMRDASDHVTFDEFHHGYAEGGDLFGALMAWSRRTSWGWAAWQLIAVGLLALLVAMGRTGPTHSVLRRARRSSLEHVRALATALHAARGHDVAVELLVRGLRRRLSRDQRPGRMPVAAWLDSLTSRVRTARARAAVTRLRSLTRSRRSVDDVLAAANAVEEVWQELHP